VRDAIASGFLCRGARDTFLPMFTDPSTTLRLAFDPVWSLPVSLFVAIGLILFVLLTYPRRVGHLSPLRRRLLVTLRLLVALLLAVSILRPELQWTKKDRKAAMLVVLGDRSRSMQTPDGPANTTRRAALIKAWEESQPVFDQLKQEMEVRYFDFDRETHPVEKPGPETPGKQTAIGHVLESIVREFQSQGLSGVILHSDGAQRSLPPFDADPRAVARRMGELQIPIFPVAYGTTGTTDTSLDLIVEDLLVDPYAFVKKTVPLRAKLRVLGAAGRKLAVRLLVEDPATRDGLKSGELKQPPVSRDAQPIVFVEPTRNTDVIPVELSYVPELPGEFKIRVEVEPLEGEIKTANNHRDTLLTVRSGGIKVAYFDSLPGEQKWLRLLNSTDQIQIDWQPVRGGRQSDLNDIDAELFQRGRYDVYLIGDVPAKVFGPELLRQLAARVDEGAGLMMIGGHHSFGAGGYADTPLADLLPVAMLRGETVPPDQVDPSQRHSEELPMIPTTRGLSHYVMRIDTPEKNRAAWLELPPLDGANKLKPKNDFVEILATSENGVPLLLANEAGRARVLAFAGNTTWRWALHGFRTAHQRFWRQVIYWLARKEDDQSQTVWVRIEPRNSLPGQTVKLSFGARTPDGKTITDADFEVSVTTPNGEARQVAVQRSGHEFSAMFSQTEQAGDYWVSVTARSPNTLPIGNATSRFLVDERDLELDNPAADHALLAELASLTGGYVITAEQHAAFLRRLQTEGLVRREETTVTRATLWDNWPFVIVFVLLLTVEWVVRKTNGLV
jgi:hypothetical protein